MLVSQLTVTTDATQLMHSELLNECLEKCHAMATNIIFTILQSLLKLDSLNSFS